jgi:hypothetical protein
MIDFEKHEGLTKEDVKRLKALTDGICKANLNKMMCHEIIKSIQSYLKEKLTSVQYIPPAGGETLHDAMLRKEQEKQHLLDKLRNELSKDKSEEQHEEDSHVMLGEQRKRRSSSLGQAPNTNNQKLIEEMNKKQFEEENLTVLHSTRRLPNTHVQVSHHITGTQNNAAEINQKHRLSLVQTGGQKTYNNNNAHHRTGVVEFSDENSEDDEDEENSKTPGAGDHKVVLYDYSRSRYYQEFTEIERLGNGASGEVWKVRHKLDQKIYAVKKINLNYRNQSLRNKIQREVTTISSLFHKNIVRYYAAWIESYEMIVNTDNDNKKPVPSVSASSSPTKLGTTAAAAAGRAPAPYLKTLFHEKKEGKQATLPSSSKSRNAWLEGNPLLKEAESQLHDEDDERSSHSHHHQYGGGGGVNNTYNSKLNKSNDYDIFFEDEDDDHDGERSQRSDENNRKTDYLEQQTLSSGFGFNQLPPYMGYDEESLVSSSSSSSSSSPSSNGGDDDDESSLDSSHSSSSSSSSDEQVKSQSKKRMNKEIEEATTKRTSDWLFIQMEYCYTDLREVIDEKEVWRKPNEIKRLLREILEALAYIHERRMIHRDLKVL